MRIDNIKWKENFWRSQIIYFWKDIKQMNKIRFVNTDQIQKKNISMSIEVSTHYILKENKKDNNFMNVQKKCPNFIQLYQSKLKSCHF